MRLIARIALVAALASTQAWAARPAARRLGAGRDISAETNAFISGYKRDPAATPLPAGANKYRYVFVRGLFGNSYPFYMSRAKKALEARGVKVEIAPINTVGSSLRNASVLIKMIKETDRPIVFVGHSKGVADLSHALGVMGKTSPELLKKSVRGVVALEGAYGGSPIAEMLSRSKWGRLTIRVLSRLMGGSPGAGWDITTGVRRRWNERAPMPTHLVPTVAFAGNKRGFFSSLMAPFAWLIKKGFGLESDGLVATRDAMIPGADNAVGSLDHAQGAFGKYSERLTVGLVSHVLRMQPAFAQ